MGTMYKYHDVAEAELLEAIAWYDTHAGRDVGERFARAVQSTLEQASRYPLSLVCIGPPYRRAPLSDFPIVAIYEVLDDASIFVLAIAHASREPNYWRDRIET